MRLGIMGGKVEGYACLWFFFGNLTLREVGMGHSPNADPVRFGVQRFHVSLRESFQNSSPKLEIKPSTS